MPYRRGGFSRKLKLVTINSEKHVVDVAISPSTTTQQAILAKAVTAPSNTVTTDCHRGGTIKAIWISLDFCGLAATGVQQNTMVYLMKNPGNNLTEPAPFAVGSSNEKKFVFKMWSQMTMRNQDGNPPYHWEGWVKIPKRYQRMGTDDILVLVFGTDTSTGHLFINVIYKEYF